jgi:ABC-2 type transport system permease protein
MSRTDDNNSGPALRLMRLKGLMRKEAFQIIRDPSSIAIAFLLPLVLLLLFGYGVSLDAEHVPAGVVVELPSAQTASFTAAFANSRYFDPITFDNIHKAEQAAVCGKITAIVWLRQGFGKDMLSGGAPPIGVIVNGVDANNARIIEGYLQGVWITWLEQYAASLGQPQKIPVSLEQRVWYNPEVRSRNFLVPGLIAIIMTLIGALLTAMVVAREWERGTMEALMVTPVSVRDILLGKLIPYFILGMGGMTLSVAMAVWLFDVPLRGSFLVLFGSSALFLIVALAMGLFISTAAKNQFLAGQAAIISTFLPAFMLSGFLFYIGSMPKPIQWFTHIVAARYFVNILQTVFLAGNIWPVILVNCLALLIMAVVLLTLVRRRTRKRLE